MQQVVKSLKSIIIEENNNDIIHPTENKMELPNDMHSYSTCTQSNNSELFISYTLDNKYKPHILNQAEKLFLEIFDAADSMDILIDKLIVLLIKTQDEGNNFNEMKNFIDQCIFLSNQKSNDIFEWLKENQIESKYLFFLGFLYFNNINFEEDRTDAFKLFLKAAKNDYPIAQVYLSECYREGIGTEINYNLAFNWMQKAVENESTCGQLNLGIYL